MDRIRAHATQIAGTGERVLVLAHGLGGNQAQWQPLVEHFQTSARVVTLALAGSAEADPALFSPVRHANILGYADDLAMLCGQLGLRDAIYVGHSMSAMAGVLASAADPGLFSRLVLLNGSARYVDDPATGYVGGFSHEQVDTILEAIAGDFAAWYSGFATAVMNQPERPEFATEFARTLGAYDPRTALVMFRAAFTSDVRSSMSRVQVPTLILQSSGDPAVPPTAAQWLAQALPQALLKILPSLGHFPHVVSPEVVIAEIEAFLLAHP